MKPDAKKITGLAMVAAIAYVVMLAGFRFMPSAPFLKYEAKDVILAIGGFIYGPAAAMATAFVVALVEMLTVSETGPVGLLMNFMAASAFACVAALVYKKLRTAKGAALGLFCGSVSLTAVMMLLNYIITPIYWHVPREVVVGMMLPVFLPFNLIKAGLNSAIILLIYKPLTGALRASRLLPESRAPSAAQNVTANPGVGAGAAMDAAGADPDGGARGGRFKINVKLLVGAAALLIICLAAIVYLKMS